ncbi:hypothetical protein PINS_up014061 [Pythium insidiosum]|nr:hypothetical protein PINS_up014060 [Pythium insidiosum]GLE05077.1 hypothetical protein PINS_up014061 [Pythium insidiosum]
MGHELFLEVRTAPVQNGTCITGSKALLQLDLELQHVVREAHGFAFEWLILCARQVAATFSNCTSSSSLIVPTMTDSNVRRSSSCRRSSWILADKATVCERHVF